MDGGTESETNGACNSRPHAHQQLLRSVMVAVAAVTVTFICRNRTRSKCFPHLDYVIGGRGGRGRLVGLSISWFS